MSETPTNPAARLANSEQLHELLGMTDEPDSMDLLGAFEPTTEAEAAPPDARGLLRTSAWMFAVAIIASIGFVSGLLWGLAHEPELGYQNLAVELAIKSVFAIGCGLLGAAIALAVTAAVAGVTWIRRRRG